MQLTYTPDEPRLFLLREKPEDPQFEPHVRIKMAHGLVSPSFISVAFTVIKDMIKGMSHMLAFFNLNHLSTENTI